MRNAWAIFDRETKARIGLGTGELDADNIPGTQIIVYRDTLAEIQLLPAVAQKTKRHDAARKLSAVEAHPDRARAKSRKADCAARFLDDVPQPDVIDPSDPVNIPPHYVELFDEYWQTYDIHTTATNPWHLARLIVQKAREKNIIESEAASMAEALRRREKVQAEITLQLPQESLPDE